MSPAQAPHEIAAEAIRLFLKYRSWDGDEAIAKIQAVSDFIDAEPGECEPHVSPKSENDQTLPWRSFDPEQPPPKGFCLVYSPINSVKFDVAYMDSKAYFDPKHPPSYGWYPGGADPHGTFWIPLSEIPAPKRKGNLT